MARKLRIFPGEQHDFEGQPDLVPLELPPRKLVGAAACDVAAWPA